jgi:large subunit ribosomal protein L5
MLPNRSFIYKEQISRDLSLHLNRRAVINLPQLEYVDISISEPTIALNKKQLLPVLTTLELLTGQKAIPVKSKKLNAQYNIRKGALIGAKVSLQSKKVIPFLENLVLFVLPQLSVEHYFNKGSVSKGGNFTFTIQDPLSFPELEKEYQKFNKLPEIHITVSTKGSTKKESRVLLSYFNFLFG